MSPNSQTQSQLSQLIALALEEDLGPGDATEHFFESVAGSWQLKARQAGVFCGSFVAEELFKQAELKIEIITLVEDGQTFDPGDVLQKFNGDSSLLTVERILLNMTQHLTAISTETARWVQALNGYESKLYDTRKTTPAYRHLEKYAVLCGGANNHRMSLQDAIMIKDNHFARQGQPKGNELKQWISNLVQNSNLPVIVEVESKEDCLSVARANPSVILLDNMSIAEMAACVEELQDEPVALEASGGITFEKLKEIAKSGVQRISVGALTQNPPRVDLGLDVL
jgi:nicotinate-nucleotide pyrophosphorylase (carboxylating)